jgi:hypothetical protein
VENPTMSAAAPKKACITMNRITPPIAMSR